MNKPYKNLQEKYSLITEGFGMSLEDWFEHYYTSTNPNHPYGPIKSWPGLQFFEKWLKRTLLEKGWPVENIADYFVTYADNKAHELDNKENRNNYDSDEIDDMASYFTYTNLRVKYNRFLKDIESPENKEWKSIEATYQQGTQATDGDWDIKGLAEGRTYRHPLDTAEKRIIDAKDFKAFCKAIRKAGINYFVRNFFVKRLGETSPKLAEAYYNVTHWLHLGISEDLLSDGKRMFNEWLQEKADLEKAQSTYQQGTQATGGDWDISGLKESTYNFPAETTVGEIVNMALSASTFEELKAASKLLPPGRFYNEIMMGIFSAKYKSHISNSYTRGKFDKGLFYHTPKNEMGAIFLAMLALADANRNEHEARSYGSERKIVANMYYELAKEYFDKALEFKKAKQTYQQGTQATGGEWDISGLQEGKKEIDAKAEAIKQITQDILSTNNFKEFTKKVKELPYLSNNVIYLEAALKVLNTHYGIKDVNYYPNTPAGQLLTAITNLQYSFEWPWSKPDWGKTKKETIETSVNQSKLFYNKWIEYKKSQEIYKQGTQITGGDWDISGLTEEESTPKQQTMFDSWFNEWVYEFRPDNIGIEEFKDYLLRKIEAAKPLRANDFFLREYDKANYDVCHKKQDEVGYDLSETDWEPDEKEVNEQMWTNLENDFINSIYQQGTQATGGDWDIKGLTENTKDRFGGLSELEHTIEHFSKRMVESINIPLEEARKVLQWFFNKHKGLHKGEKFGFLVFKHTQDYTGPVDQAIADFYNGIYDQYKAEKIYQQGTQATGGDWDISGLTESIKYVDLNSLLDNLVNADSYDDFKNALRVITFNSNINSVNDNKAPFISFSQAIVQRFGNYNMSMNDDNDNLNLSDRFWRACYEVQVASAYGSSERRVNLSIKYFNEWREAYNEWLKAQDTYKQGTQATGKEWDISGLT